MTLTISIFPISSITCSQMPLAVLEDVVSKARGQVQSVSPSRFVLSPSRQSVIGILTRGPGRLPVFLKVWPPLLNSHSALQECTSSRFDTTISVSPGQRAAPNKLKYQKTLQHYNIIAPFMSCTMSRTHVRCGSQCNPQVCNLFPWVELSTSKRIN